MAACEKVKKTKKKHKLNFFEIIKFQMYFFLFYQFVDGLQFGGITNSVRGHRSDTMAQIRISSVTKNF